MAWNDVNIQFGNTVRRIREGRKMSQEEFAGMCGISRAYYGRIERGEHSVTLEVCQKFQRQRGYLFRNYLRISYKNVIYDVDDED